MTPDEIALCGAMGDMQFTPGSKTAKLVLDLWKKARYATYYELAPAQRTAVIDIAIRFGDQLPADVVALAEKMKAEPEPASAPAQKPKGGNLAMVAANYCRDPMFWRWINRTFNPTLPVTTENQAALRLYDLCRIHSRAELDHNDQAAQDFHQRVRKPFMNWRHNERYRNQGPLCQ